ESDIPIYFEAPIQVCEVEHAVKRLKLNKSAGIDDIPAEVLKSKHLLNMLCSLYNRCFSLGRIPKIWNRGIIVPVPKSTTSDARDPMSYRGINITPAIYKLYCNILNDRLMKWEQENSVVSDVQNGFRKGRSTIDHVLALTSIIETRKLKRQPTFAAFIDFRKAYDAINRKLLFKKLGDLGVSGRMFGAITSLYDNVNCCVRLNGIKTEWFEVTCGLKQGCNLSTILFNLYINDIVEKIKATNKGIDIDGEKVSILLYADDLILLASSESDLQLMLNELNIWCDDNKMTINEDKSNVMHFRPNSMAKTGKAFKCGEKTLNLVDRYKYLGLLLTEHLNYEEMAKHVAKSASRALSLVIAKYKSCGGFAFGTYTKLYETMVWSIISYGASIWGSREYNCINSVQLKAARFFLGVGRYTPNAGVLGDIGWDPVVSKQWKAVIRQWSRMHTMDEDRINFKIYKWSERSSSRSCRNWHFRVEALLAESGIDVQFVNTNLRNIANQVYNFQLGKFKDKWLNDVNRVNARQGTGKNKLRLYRCFKSEYKTENYVSCLMPRCHRSAYSKFRCGVAPIRIETGRYERLALEDRRCFNCVNHIENEEHVLLYCPIYEDLRKAYFTKILEQHTDFEQKTFTEKLSFILGESDDNTLRQSAKFCSDILNRRRNVIYK
ncbi:MAG: reverse transcriptase family protein, partial [Candidatus Thiodiazotropha sp.]